MVEMFTSALIYLRQHPHHLFVQNEKEVQTALWASCGHLFIWTIYICFGTF